MNTSTTHTDENLSIMTMNLVRAVGQHTLLTSDDYLSAYDYDATYWAASIADALVAHLVANEHIDSSFEMLTWAYLALENLTDDVLEFEDTQDVDKETVDGIVSAYGKVCIRLNKELDPNIVELLANR